MEAVENCLAQIVRNAWAFVVDTDQNFLADMDCGNLNQSVGRRETYRIVDDVVDCPR